jgi:hypothetical protein
MKRREALRGRRGVVSALIALSVVVLVVVGASALLLRGSGQESSAGPSLTPESARATALASPSATEQPQAHLVLTPVTGPAPSMVAQVANGFLGECVEGGKPVLCTSADGATWSLRPDPAIFRLTGKGSFFGWSIAHGDAGWVATGTTDPGTWFSADGVTWTPVNVNLKGLQRAHVQAMAKGFAMIAYAWDGLASTARVLVSTDGRSWTPGQWDGGAADFSLAGAIGLVAQQTEDVYPQAPQYTSSDGVKWEQLTLPRGIHSLTSTVRLSGGGYVGIGNPFDGGQWLLRSDHGATTIWQYATGLGPEVELLAQVGQRLVVMARVQGTDTEALWESTDGASWRRAAVLGASPTSLTGIVGVGDRIGLFEAGRLAAVAEIVESGPATSLSPTAAPQSSASPTPGTTADAVVVGGWRWHRMNTVPDSRILHLPHGYLGRCGDSMCTSRDEWSWQSPPDPSIFVADSTALFTPRSYASMPGGNSVIVADEGVWHSSDGVHWQPATLPDAHVAVYNLGVGPGFALTAQLPRETVWSGWDCHLYVSADGASWTDEGSMTCVDPVAIALSERQSNPAAGIIGQAKGGDHDGQWVYSADGRTWNPMTLPPGVSPNMTPQRLSNGTLVTVCLLGPLLRSTDGLTWTVMPGPWTADSEGHLWLDMAVAGNGILVRESTAYSEPIVMWESSDGGSTFHRWAGPSLLPSQLGDMVRLQMDDGTSWAGAPLPASESSETPSASSLPVSSPLPIPPANELPAAAISRQEAIRIAAVAVHAPANAIASADAEAQFGCGYVCSWAWNVLFWGPGITLPGDNCAEVDAFTGEVIYTSSADILVPGS